MCFPPSKSTRARKQERRWYQQKFASWKSEGYTGIDLGNLRKLNSKLAGVLHHQIKAKGISGTPGNAGWVLNIIRGLVERCLKNTQILRPSSSLHIGSFHFLKKVLDCSKSLFRYFHYNALFGQPNKTDSLWTEGHQTLESLTANKGMKWPNAQWLLNVDLLQLLECWSLVSIFQTEEGGWDKMKRSEKNWDKDSPTNGPHRSSFNKSQNHQAPSIHEAPIQLITPSS